VSAGAHPNWNEVTAFFGGTFDPPHLGHREAVRGLFQAPGVRQVRVLPAATPPLKPEGTPPVHRVAMARLNFAPQGTDVLPGEVIVDTREIERAAATGRPSFTFDTLLEARTDFPKAAFVIGSDQLRDFDRWHRFRELLALAHWIVLERRPTGERLSRETLREWEASGLARPSSGGPFPCWQLAGGSKALILVPTEAPAISSTHIRETLGRTGKPPEGLVLSTVFAYLKQNRLYGTEKANDDELF
jgi:nicotinate-nucleotide adenylyltransferase